MNQILMVENKKKKSNMSTPLAIKKIIRFFALAIIVFSLCIIGHSSYALYRDSKGNNTENLPEINVNRVNDTLVVDVQSTYIINKFRYCWENSEETSIPEESTNFQEEIILPNGNNVLTIILEDETGRAVTYTKEIILDGLDIAKPTIEINGQGQSVKIQATDDTAINYITYRIDDGEEIRIDKENEEDTQIEYTVNDIERGEHTIYVTAVDLSGNVAKQERTVIVSSKPEITELNIDKENGKIIIGASDIDGLQSIEINLNGSVHTLNDINKKDIRISLSLVEGKNTLNIKITNINGLSTVGVTEFDYAR